MPHTQSLGSKGRRVPCLHCSQRQLSQIPAPGHSILPCCTHGVKQSSGRECWGARLCGCDSDQPTHRSTQPHVSSSAAHSPSACIHLQEPAAHPDISIACADVCRCTSHKSLKERSRLQRLIPVSTQVAVNSVVIPLMVSMPPQSLGPVSRAFTLPLSDGGSLGRVLAAERTNRKSQGDFFFLLVSQENLWHSADRSGFGGAVFKMQSAGARSQEPALWLLGLNLYLWLLQVIWVRVQVLAALLLFQFPIVGLGNQERMVQVLGTPHSHGRAGGDPWLWTGPQLQLLQPFGE